MEWIEARVSTTSEGVEIVLGKLMQYGINSVQIVDDTDMQRFLRGNPMSWDYVDNDLMNRNDSTAQVIFYVPPGADGREIITHAQSGLASLLRDDWEMPLGSLEISINTVDDAAWLNEWKKYYKPFRIGRSVVVVPVWEEYAPVPGDIVFTSDPGSVFGTGLHPTTQLCVEALEDYVRPECVVLDVGCGSGILSIISLLLGASSALGCDLDPAAAAAGYSNLTHNPINPASYTAKTGDIFSSENLRREIEQNRYDIVVANIVADVIVGLSRSVLKWLKPGGFFIASGIITERLNDVASALSEAGLYQIKILERDGWHCVICHA